MTVPGVYSPSQGDPFAATIRAAAESDGIQRNEVRAVLEQFVSTASVGKRGACVMRSKYVHAPASVYWRAVAALNALRALEGE